MVDYKHTGSSPQKPVPMPYVPLGWVVIEEIELGSASKVDETLRVEKLIYPEVPYGRCLAKIGEAAVE